MADDIPQHAHERIAEMRARKLFTSDLSVNEFLLVKEAGFDPLGLVMGSSIYQITPALPSGDQGQTGCELKTMSKALYHARELAMNRMEEEAEELGADGIIGVRLTVKLGTTPLQQNWKLYQKWQDWARGAGFPRTSTLLGVQWEDWRDVASDMWRHYCQQIGWLSVPLPPWEQPWAMGSSFGPNVAEFRAIGCAVRHRGGESYKNARGKPFQSDLNGQDFWTLIRTGFRPVGFVMGNCVYYVPPALLSGTSSAVSEELAAYTHALYDARELATERLQDEAEALGATGIVGVTFAEREHSFRLSPWNAGNAAYESGEVIELFVIGTAVVSTNEAAELDQPELVLLANDAASPSAGGE